MATVQLNLGAHKSKKTGLVPIYLLVTQSRIKTYIPIPGLKIAPENWSDRFLIKKTEKNIINHSTTNQYLLSLKTKALQTINSLAETGEIVNMSSRQLADRISIELFNSIKKNTQINTVQGFALSIADNLEIENAHGTAKCYRDVCSFLDRRAKMSIQFYELTYSMLLKIEESHIRDGKTINSLSFYMRTLRSVINKAAKQGLIKKELSPFNQYKIRSQKTNKRAITVSDIIKLKDAAIHSKSVNAAHSYNYFMFSFYTAGMNFTDMALLKLSNIIDNRIVYVRKKTKTNFSIKLSEPAMEIIEQYTSGKTKNDYIFPIIQQQNNITEKQKRLVIENARHVYNNWLKKIAVKVGIETNMSSYVSRHSWASNARKSGIPIEVISQGLGHGDTKTTEIYLECFPDEIIDNAIDKVSQIVNK